MISRIWRVAHPLFTLTLVVCCAYLLWRDSHRPGFGRLSQPGPERLSTHEDTPLRNFLGVKWLGGDYELPKGEEHCAVVPLRFEDGKFRGREGGKVFSPQPDRSRVVPFYIMWGPGLKGTHVISGWPGMWGSSNDNSFFAKLDKGVNRTYGPSAGFGEIRGYRVIGFATSSQTRAGQEKYGQIGGGDIDFALRTRQFVLVLGVKPFATEEEAKDWVYNQREPEDP